MLYERFEIPESRLEEKHLICGGISKIVSVLVSYPLTTIRTRIQQNQFVGNKHSQKYSSTQEIVSKILSEEGLGGLFKGMSANILRGVGQKSIYFYSYEIFKDLMFEQKR